MLSIDKLERRDLLTAGGHQSTLPLETGSWDADGVFQAHDVVAGETFELSGCGLVNTAANGQGGGSRFSADATSVEYLFSTDADGCIAQAASATYTAPSKPGWYSIDLYAWDSESPYGEIAEGTVWIKVKKR